MQRVDFPPQSKYLTYLSWLALVGLCGSSFALLLGALGRSWMIAETLLVNQTGDDIVITPVGRDEGGHIAPLHPVRGFAGRPGPALTGLPVRADEPRSLRYDWDDITLGAILVRRPGSTETFMVEVDAGLNVPGCCNRAHHASYLLPPLTRLEPAPAWVAPCFDGARVPRPPRAPRGR